MTAEQFKLRTKEFALRVIRVAQSMPKTSVVKVLSGQLLRAGTSVAANYRAACRARSKAEFRAKLGIAEEECDESIFWLEMIVEAGILPAPRLQGLIGEASEILSILVASINKSRRNSETKP